MKLFCDALASGKYFPNRFGGKAAPGGQNISPPFTWTDIPAGTKSFALTIIDSHPSAHGFVHWLVVNMSGNARGLQEAASQSLHKLPEGSVELRNGFGVMGYGGPSLQRSAGMHEMIVTLYALNQRELAIGPISPLNQFQVEIKGKVLATAILTAAFGQ
jgi:Raf kinase inhibitor-like YbhB/YbcL family protein